MRSIKVDDISKIIPMNNRVIIGYLSDSVSQYTSSSPNKLKIIMNEVNQKREHSVGILVNISDPNLIINNIQVDANRLIGIEVIYDTNAIEYEIVTSAGLKFHLLRAPDIIAILNSEVLDILDDKE